MKDVLAHGTWPSPLSAADLFAGVASPANLVIDGDELWWTEARPSENGRQALVRHCGGRTTDVGPGDWNCRTRVHEYGGAPFAVRGDDVVGAHYGDQGWYRLGGDEPCVLTPEPQVAAGRRYADARFVADTPWLVAVEELHVEDGEPRNRVVAVGVEDGGVNDLCAGRDFVAAPRPSPDGSRVAWLAWDHPFMPWDAAELWVATFADGEVRDAEHVRGGPGSSVCSPVWVDDAHLAFAEEQDGRWVPTILTLDTGRMRPMPVVDGEVGQPDWRFGGQAIAPLADGRQAWVVTEQGVDRLVIVDRLGESVTAVGLAGVRFGDLRTWRDGVAFIATEPDGTTTVSTWTETDGQRDVRRFPVAGLRDGDLPEVEAVTLPTPDGAVTHAFVHLPANAEVMGPEDELPPLLVFTHGGPTGRTPPVTSRMIAYWTTRGFAVADVNYRGSAGYGQAYRESLVGRWGELDVVDTIAVARGLAERGVVDGARMAIRGGSAGGFTTLAVLTTPDHPFACGTSFFGVADLEALAEHTHKFESRYLDRLVGPLPEAADVYRERSPIHRTDQLSRPLLVLQGLEDEVVPPAQSEAIVAAAAANGIPHAYLAFEGEQHGFRQLDNLVTWHESELAFYGQVLGFTPAGDLPDLDLTTD